LLLRVVAGREMGDDGREPADTGEDGWAEGSVASLRIEMVRIEKIYEVNVFCHLIRPVTG
jgi:hypothetical protein